MENQELKQEAAVEKTAEEIHIEEVKKQKDLKIYKENLEHNLKILRLEEEFNRLRLSSLQCSLDYDSIINELRKRAQEGNAPTMQVVKEEKTE